MFVNDIFEEVGPSKIVIVYPGRFQPFHRGHKAVYDFLVTKYGSIADIFIATSNKVDPPRSPFNFAEKTKLMDLAGIDLQHVVQSKNPYQAIEIVEKYDPETTRLIFAVSEKDMADDPRFRFAPKKNGEPSYFQPAPRDWAKMEPFNRHGYIITVPTFNFKVLGEPVKSATEIRAKFAQADESTKKKIIRDLFGDYNDEVYDLMSSRILENLNERSGKKRQEFLYQIPRRGGRPYDTRRVRGGVEGTIFRATNELNKIFDQIVDLPAGTKVKPKLLSDMIVALNKIKSQLEFTVTSESLIKYDAKDPMNSEFAPESGIGKMTLRGWKKDIILALRQLADRSKYLDLETRDGWDALIKQIGPHSSFQIKLREIIDGHNTLEKKKSRTESTMNKSVEESIDFSLVKTLVNPDNNVIAQILKNDQGYFVAANGNRYRIKGPDTKGYLKKILRHIAQGSWIVKKDQLGSLANAELIPTESIQQIKKRLKEAYEAKVKANGSEDRPISPEQLAQLEKYADLLFKASGLDVSFTRHFFQRVNDARNGKQITPNELKNLFNKVYAKFNRGKDIIQLGVDAEAVLKDMSNDINMPFVLVWDHRNKEFDLVAKTIMRKKNFRTSSPELRVENKK